MKDPLPSETITEGPLVDLCRFMNPDFVFARVAVIHRWDHVVGERHGSLMAVDSGGSDGGIGSMALRSLIEWRSSEVSAVVSSCTTIRKWLEFRRRCSA